ncbi:MAG TPA: PKD domain-containing protein, partial [Bacteroidales bacterium]|nr:PKD domain-containing protein [Bacteroidales bacterium]
SVSINTVNVRCFGLNDGQATATVTGGTAPYNYTWGPSGIAGNTPVASSLYAGTYTLTVTDANTCQTVTQIVINEPTLLGYSYSTTDLLCYGDSDGIIDITPSGGVAPYNYTWAPNVSSSNSASGLTAGTYTITITDANGCDTVANIDINQPPQLVLSTTGNYSACLNETVTFGASATGGVTPYVFDWDNGLGQGDSFTITATTTTTYNVTVTDANNCTSGPLSLTITVYPPLALNVVANPSNICDGDPVVLTATGGGGNGGPYTYTWDNGINTNSSSVTVFPNVTTTYSVTVSDNCTTPLATASTIVTVYPTPTASFTSDVFNGCQPFTVNFIDLSSPNNIQSWAWNFGDPSSGANNSSNQQNPTHTFNQSGTYNISLSVTTPDGCKNTYVYNNMITVYPKPIPSFVATPNPGSTLNSLITFSDASIYASYWNWNFGDNLSLNNTSNLPSPTHTYLSAGDYVVTLVVTSDYGCIDSTTNIIKILQDFMFWAPNAFTPNENGINDIWKPYGVNIDPDNYELYIYDRWGKEIFFTRDINQGWDGTINNTPAQEGIYNWLCKVKELNGKKHIYKGRITLYR